MGPNWLLAAATTGALLLAAPVFGGRNQIPVWQTLAVAVALAGVVWIGFAGLWLIRRWTFDYELTDRRLLHREGVLARRHFRIELIDIDDVSHTQSLWQRLVGVGDIVVHSNDRSHPELLMRGIARVQYVADRIDQARREERRRRGVFVEGI